MGEAFDPYHKWLGIPPAEQPPNHYRLLGIAWFEDDADVIEAAADRQMAHVRTYQSGKHSEASQAILNELSAARLTLLDRQKKTAYDAMLRDHLAQQYAAAEPTPFGQNLLGAFRYLHIQWLRFWIGWRQLPADYRALGAHLSTRRAYHEDFPSLYDQLELVVHDLAATRAIDSANGQTAEKENAPEEPRPGILARLTRWLKATRYTRRRNSLLRQLGRSAFRADGEACGPAELTQPIRERHDRLGQLRSELARLGMVPPGDSLSPKRLAWLMAGLTVFIVLLFAWLAWLL